MTRLGIIEGFFGPEWSLEARLSCAPFLKRYGGAFYIYAPKRDAQLRRLWRAEWSPEYTTFLSSLCKHFQSYGVKFGVGCSPLALGSTLSISDRELLRTRFAQLSGLGVDYLGLFFDDMPVTDGMLAVQSEVIALALEFIPRGLIFCPSFYSYDPILEKVFGKRPPGYLEGLKDAIRPDVEICWSGPKVISELLDREHLGEVVNLLGRPPFIWENFFANDGPRNCKFLKLRNFTGRDEGLLTLTSAVGFNLMNQPYLSQLVFLAAVFVIRDLVSPEEGFRESLHTLCSPGVAQFINENRAVFLEQGLDSLSCNRRQELESDPRLDDSPIAEEMRSWLRGEYVVGPECLTD
ncbi:MAG: hypothetical protein RIS36_1600 [Pseudomonadota bacterium]